MEQKYEEHLKKKVHASEEKQIDKVRAGFDSSFTSGSFDLQSVLTVPCGNVIFPAN